MRLLISDWQFIKKMVKVAEECKAHSNYLGYYRIWGGIADRYVWRLRTTMDKLERDPAFSESLKQLRIEMNAQINFQTYRDFLPNVQISNESRPCIPCLGVLLFDLLQIDKNEPDILDTVDSRSDIINFLKMRREYEAVYPLLQYRRVSYNFKRVDTIHNLFALGLERLSRAKRDKLSSSLDPEGRSVNNRPNLPFPYKGHAAGQAPDHKPLKVHTLFFSEIRPCILFLLLLTRA